MTFTLKRIEYDKTNYEDDDKDLPLSDEYWIEYYINDCLAKQIRQSVSAEDGEIIFYIKMYSPRFSQKVVDDIINSRNFNKIEEKWEKIFGNDDGWEVKGTSVRIVSIDL